MYARLFVWMYAGMHSNHTRGIEHTMQGRERGVLGVLGHWTWPRRPCENTHVHVHAINAWRAATQNACILAREEANVDFVVSLPQP